MELNTISGLAIAGVICSVVLSMGDKEPDEYGTVPSKEKIGGTT